jgi:hypothetical protein
MTELMEPRFSITNGDEILFSSSDDEFASVLLALLCHSNSVAGSDITCDVVTPARAQLLSCYGPKQVRARVAEPSAATMLRTAGIDVVADGACGVDEAAACDGAAIVALAYSSPTASEFHDELRARLLTTLQKGGSVSENWAGNVPESLLGGGGGGT